MDIYDVAIIGLGPAGVTAAVYAGRKKLKAVIIGESIGGQSVVSRKIENWIGIPELSGADMAMRLYDHLDMVKGQVDIIDGFKVDKIDPFADEGKPAFKIIYGNKEISARTVLIASGSRRRKLQIPNEDKFAGNGVFYCSICDAPLMQNKTAAVIGGGNAGVEAVNDLLHYADKIYLLEIMDELRGDKVTCGKVLAHKHVELILNAKTVEIKGGRDVEAVVYEDLKTGLRHELPVQGIFIQIGAVPNSELAKGLVKLDNYGQIIVDPISQKTSRQGIWSAGDVTQVPYKQNNIAMGDAAKAMLNIDDYLLKL